MNCKICGSPIDAENYISDVREAMLKHQMCFSCNFWRNRLEEDATLPPHTWCMINGTHYIVGNEDSKSYFRGFGGREFHIKFNDGTIVTTTNLWCQGEPEGYWRKKFPDNAVFLNGEQWKQIGRNQYLIGEEIPDRLIALQETALGM
jgi:hypothetical protein